MGRTRSGLVGWLISILVIAGAVWAGYRVYREPFLIKNLLPGSQGQVALTFGGPGTGPGLFQEATGNIIFQYASLDGTRATGQDATIGIQNLDRTIGLN